MRKQEYVDFGPDFELGIDFEIVVDWEDRIAAYSEETKQIYYTAFEKMKEMESMLTDKTLNWAVQQDSKKKGQELFFDQATSKKGFPCIRVWSYTDYDTVTSLRAYSNEDIRKEYDRNVEQCKPLEKLGCNLMIAYQATHKIVTVASRDVYQACFMDAQKDGTIKTVYWGMDKPEVKGKVRMELPLAGMIFKPLKDDPRGKTQVCLFLEASLGGSIPGWI